MKIIAPVLALALTGCATLFDRHADLITVTSPIPGSTILINGAPAGENRVEYMLSRGAPAQITVEKPGCKARTIQTTRGVAPLAWLNVLSYGIGFLIDSGSGALMRAHPREYRLSPICE